MSEDIGDKIKQVAEMLGQNSNTNIPDNVLNLFSMLMSNNKSEDSSEEDSDRTTGSDENASAETVQGEDQSERSSDHDSRSSHGSSHSSHKSHSSHGSSSKSGKTESSSGHSSSNNKNTNDNMDEMAEMARKMKKAMGMMGAANDPRSTLLNAIRPYLNKSRQKKLQTCMKLIQIGGLAKILDDSD